MPNSIRKTTPVSIISMLKIMMLWIGSLIILAPRRFKSSAEPVNQDLGNLEDQYSQFYETYLLSNYNKTTYVLNKEEHRFSNQLLTRLDTLITSYNKPINPFLITVSQYNQFDIECYFYSDAVNFKIEFLIPNLQYITLKDKMTITTEYQKNKYQIMRHIINSLTQTLTYNGTLIFPNISTNEAKIEPVISDSVTLKLFSYDESEVLSRCQDVQNKWKKAGNKLRVAGDILHLSCMRLRAMIKIMSIDHNESPLKKTLKSLKSTDLFIDKYLRLLEENQGFSGIDNVIDTIEHRNHMGSNPQANYITMLESMHKILISAVSVQNALAAAYAISALTAFVQTPENRIKKIQGLHKRMRILFDTLSVAAKEIASVEIDTTRTFLSNEIRMTVSFFSFMNFIFNSRVMELRAKLKKQNFNSNKEIHKSLVKAFIIGAQHDANNTDNSVLYLSRILAADEEIENQFLTYEIKTSNQWYHDMIKDIERSDQRIDTRSIKKIIDAKQLKSITRIHHTKKFEQLWIKMLTSKLLPSHFNEREQLPYVISIKIASIDLNWLIYFTRLPKTVVIHTQSKHINENKIIRTNLSSISKEWNEVQNSINAIAETITPYIIDCIQRNSPNLPTLHLDNRIVDEVQSTALTETEYQLNQRCQTVDGTEFNTHDIASACHQLMQSHFTEALLFKEIIEIYQPLKKRTREYLDKYVLKAPFELLTSISNKNNAYTLVDEKISPLLMKYVLATLYFRGINLIKQVTEMIKKKNYSYWHAECVLIFTMEHLLYLIQKKTGWSNHVKQTNKKLLMTLDYISSIDIDPNQIFNQDMRDLLVLTYRLVGTAVKNDYFTSLKVTSPQTSKGAPHFYLKAAALDTKDNLMRLCFQLVMDQNLTMTRQQLVKLRRYYYKTTPSTISDKWSIKQDTAVTEALTTLIQFHDIPKNHQETLIKIRHEKKANHANSLNQTLWKTLFQPKRDLHPSALTDFATTLYRLGEAVFLPYYIGHELLEYTPFTPLEARVIEWSKSWLLPVLISLSTILIYHFKVIPTAQKNEKKLTQRQVKTRTTKKPIGRKPSVNLAHEKFKQRQQVKQTINELINMTFIHYHLLQQPYSQLNSTYFVDHLMQSEKISLELKAKTKLIKSTLDEQADSLTEKVKIKLICQINKKWQSHIRKIRTFIEKIDTELRNITNKKTRRQVKLFWGTDKKQNSNSIAHCKAYIALNDLLTELEKTTHRNSTSKTLLQTLQGDLNSLCSYIPLELAIKNNEIKAAKTDTDKLIEESKVAFNFSG